MSLSSNVLLLASWLLEEEMVVFGHGGGDGGLGTDFGDDDAPTPAPAPDVGGVCGLGTDFRDDVPAPAPAPDVGGVCGLVTDFGDDDAPAPTPDAGGVCGMLLSLLLTPCPTIIIGFSVFPTSATSWKVMLLSLLLPPCSPPIVYSTIAASGSWGYSFLARFQGTW
jgi:hypothetical protein